MKNTDFDPNLAAWLGDSDALPVPDSLPQSLDQAYAASPPAEEASQAIRRLRQSLEEQLVEKIYFDTLEGTSLGTVFVAVGPRGLTALSFGVTEEDFLAQVEKRTGVRPVRAAEPTQEIEAQVSAYLAGERTRFNFPVDLESLTKFQRQVLEAAAEIPRGQVMTYSELARRIGRPLAYRAVGQALGRNPVPLVIPCHRVIAADGSLTGYSGGGGIKTKARLLALEGVHLL